MGKKGKNFQKGKTRLTTLDGVFDASGGGDVGGPKKKKNATRNIVGTEQFWRGSPGTGEEAPV